MMLRFLNNEYFIYASERTPDGYDVNCIDGVFAYRRSFYNMPHYIHGLVYWSIK